MNTENKKKPDQLKKSSYSLTKLLILTLTPILFIIIFAFYLQQNNKFLIFPGNNDINCYTYSDNSAGGNSQILHYEQKDSEILLKYQFGNSLESAYTGLTFMTEKSKVINLKEYSQILLILESDFPRISLYIKYYVPGYSEKENYPSYNTKEATFNYTPDKKTYIINLQEFSTPSWWYELNGVSKDIEPLQADFIPDYELSIGFNGLPEDSKIYNLKISQFALVKDYMLYWIVISIIIIAYYITLILFFKKKQKVNINKELSDSIISYLSENFNQPRLTLKQSAADLDLNPKLIQQLLYYNFKRDFKTYILDLKLAKAKEILTNTNNNISEIAYFLGFKYPSYFNRIFHQAFGLSPGEYRKQHKKD